MTPKWSRNKRLSATERCLARVTRTPQEGAEEVLVPGSALWALPLSPNSFPRPGTHKNCTSEKHPREPRSPTAQGEPCQ